jgi:hypothetical protein
MEKWGVVGELQALRAEILLRLEKLETEILDNTLPMHKIEFQGIKLSHIGANCGVADYIEVREGASHYDMTRLSIISERHLIQIILDNKEEIIKKFQEKYVEEIEIAKEILGE